MEMLVILKTAALHSK